jgi:hypothetical protein
MNFWIFQAVPGRFDLRDPANLHDGMDGWWHATRYRTRMCPGDLVYFWLGGDEATRGIYGWGRITSEPYEKHGGFRVDVHVQRRLPAPVNIAQIRATPKLDNLLILRIAIGSNFLINRREAAAIDALMPEALQPEVRADG